MVNILLYLCPSLLFLIHRKRFDLITKKKTQRERKRKERRKEGRKEDKKRKKKEKRERLRILVVLWLGRHNSRILETSLSLPSPLAATNNPPLNSKSNSKMSLIFLLSYSFPCHCLTSSFISNCNWSLNSHFVCVPQIILDISVQIWACHFPSSRYPLAPC